MKKLKFTKKKGIVILIVFAAVLAVVFFATKAKVSAKSSTRVIPPTTTQITSGDFDQRVTASGTTEASDPYSIFIELSQEVKTVHVDVGDYVEEGQLLVTYDIEDTKKELEDKLSDAKITLQNAQITLAELVEPAEGTELIDLKTAVVSAQKALQEAKISLSEYETNIAEAEKNLPYYKQLLEAGSLSQSEYDNYAKEYNTLLDTKITKENAVASAELALEKANTNLENGTNKLNDKSTSNSYQKQLNTVSSAQRNIASIQEEISKLTEATYSPISGTIIECNAVEGQMLTDSTVMMQIADLTDLNVSAYVSEYDIAKVAVGQKVELTTDGIEDTTYMGTVTKIEPTAVTQGTISGSETVVPILVHMDAPDALVKPGFSFDMEIIVVDLKDANYIPVSAVVKDKETDSYCVYVVGEGQKLEKRDVEIGTMSDMYAEILSGLEEDETIMESPTGEVTDGSSLMDYATHEAAKDSKETSSEGILSGLTGGANQGGNQGGMQGGGGMPPSGGGGGRPGM
ncbi:MAG: efflux RND transporter periplasmic adaptor subunit [Lachnospiraceae bacterium]|nr:efflux RND transporter periplasmic adaptor subunit [Lachnospiraceae bacterium]